MPFQQQVGDMYWKELSKPEIRKWDKRLKKRFKSGLPSYEASNIVNSGVYQLRGRIFKWPHFICYSRTKDEHDSELRYFHMHFRLYGKEEKIALKFESTNTTDTLARRIQKALASPGVEDTLNANLPENAPEEVKITIHELRTWLANCLTEVKSLS